MSNPPALVGLKHVVKTPTWGASSTVVHKASLNVPNQGGVAVDVVEVAVVAVVAVVWACTVSGKKATQPIVATRDETNKTDLMMASICVESVCCWVDKIKVMVDSC